MPRSRATQVRFFQRLSANRLTVLLSALLLACPAAALAQGKPRGAQQLALAREFYNTQRYEQAITSAREAAKNANLADRANLILGRSYLERFRSSGDTQDLDTARTALRGLQAIHLSATERTEWLIGLGECLYLDNSYGAASELFESALAPTAPPDVRSSALDWWATSLDRLADSGGVDDTEALYNRIVSRMQRELENDAASEPASYWLAAAFRGTGDLDRAWNAAIAGWVRAALSPIRGAELRADLDRLVQTALIPERAREMADTPQDREKAQATLKAEWETVKTNWK